MNIDGEDYYYQKNMLGDICAIYSSAGELACRYVYDAWGNHRLYDKDGNQIDDDGATVGSKNPFRYRGYYWDREILLYYLQSRYYDPALGRFISPDGVDYLDPKSICGMNLYAYCGDNPVMNADPSGCLTLGFFSSFIMQFTASTYLYLVFTFAAIFDKNIREDMKRIKWNPFNTDEDAVLASRQVSFYKGVPVVRTSNGRSGSFLAIALQRDFSNKETFESRRDYVRHEWGHVPQFLSLGPWVYGAYVAIPSWQKFGDYKGATGSYYNAPWEAIADIFGGTTRTHASKYDDDAIAYYWQLLITSIFTFI